MDTSLININVFKHAQQDLMLSMVFVINALMIIVHLVMKTLALHVKMDFL